MPSSEFQVFCYFPTIGCLGLVGGIWVSSFLLVEVVNLTHARVI